MSRKTTLIQIAEAAGVSLSTVDRVVNRRGGVSPKAETKVLEWARRLSLDRRIDRSYLKNLRIAVLMQSPQNPFYRALRDAFGGLRATMSDMKIGCFIHHIDVTDVVGTTEKIEEVSKSYDGLIITCPDDPKLSDALRLAARRVPIVTLVTDLPNSGRIAYVGPDNRQIGRVAGELMGRFLGTEGGDILIVLGMQRMTGHEEREMGFRSVLRERFPGCSIVASLESGESQERAGELVLDALQGHPGVRGIYNVSAGNLAIARTIQSLGLAHRIVMITHELTPARRQMLRDGILDAVIDQNPWLEAQRALEVLGRHFQRSEAEIRPNDYTPYNIFIRENCPAID
jgi:LacI family transcriptional regulator